MNSPNKSATEIVADFLFFHHFFKRLFSRTRVIKFSTGSGKFYIYNGEGVDADNLVGSYNYVSAPPTYISKAADGALTVKFDGPTSTYTKYDGFEMQVSLHELTPFVVDGIEASAPRTDDVTRGASNAPMQKLL